MEIEVVPSIWGDASGAQERWKYTLGVTPPEGSRAAVPEPRALLTCARQLVRAPALHPSWTTGPVRLNGLQVRLSMHELPF